MEFCGRSKLSHSISSVEMQILILICRNSHLHTINAKPYSLGERIVSWKSVSYHEHNPNGAMGAIHGSLADLNRGLGNGAEFADRDCFGSGVYRTSW